MIRKFQAGFTIVELAIVVTIIAVLLATIFQGMSMLETSRVQDVISLSQDVSVAMREFKKRYHLYPGDMSINPATPQIAGLNPACVPGGNNDGIIQTTESPCVPEMLFGAGILGKVDRDPTSGIAIFKTYYGNPTVVASSTLPGTTTPVAIVMPPSVPNALLLTNVPCAVAMEIDSKMDDGNLTTGKVIGSVLSCTPSTVNDPVPYLAIGL